MPVYLLRAGAQKTCSRTGSAPILVRRAASPTCAAHRPSHGWSRWRSKRFVKDICSGREAAPLKKSRLEPVLEEPEPSQIGPETIPVACMHGVWQTKPTRSLYSLPSSFFL
jgi:hypothetical protein